ncbi:MRG/MORF4L-binding protein [Stomoxys calcitrans]|uniref:MRG-binding protein n=1 Tax=Stomoxys calcitrans TaxID=35570 RepID=A0A1I8P2D4_STOCA|nr:MRG/MORF4L-binding protein [Stomoxys calcitrans]
MTMTARERNSTSSSDQWTPEEEIHLFFAMGCLKPVGVNKHFYMACIAERLSSSLNRDFTTESIWGHLRTLYNLEALDDLEPLPFPNEEKEFSLPEAEFSSLLKKIKEPEEIKPNNEQPSIIAIATDNINKDKSLNQIKTTPSNTPTPATPKDLDKKLIAKLSDGPKRTPKRTRGSVSLESNSPSTTPPPPPLQSSKRRRI